MSALRDKILKKYGVSQPGTSSKGSGPTIVDDKALAPSTMPAPAEPVNLRDKILSKYLEKEVDEKSGKTTYKSRVPEKAPAPKVDIAEKLGLPKTELRAPTGNEVPANSLQDALMAVNAPNLLTKNTFTDVIGGAFDDYVSRSSKFLSLLDNSKEENTPLKRTMAGIEATVGVVNLLFSPISASFQAAEKIPVAGKAFELFNYGFEKLGEAASWGAEKGIDQLPLSPETKETIKPAIQEVASLATQVVVGGKVAKKVTPIVKARSAELAAKLTQDLIIQNKLPDRVYIEPSKIKSIFQTGENISKAELDLVTSLGLDAKGYRDAIRNGVTIEVPATTIVTLVDKPYWAKLKETFGVAATEKVVSVDTGKPQVGPRGFLEAPKGGSPVPSSTVVPEGVQKLSRPTISADTTPAPAKVQVALKSPVSPKLLETIKAFTPEESQAFGKKIIQRINEEVGLKISDKEATSIPDNIKVNELKSGDGRPAQFNNQGKIEVFLPNLVEDLALLSKGNEILAHPDTPQYSKVYKLTDGETIEQLAVRYVRDVLIHEKSHEKTMTIADMTLARQLQSEINTARASGNQKALTEAQTKMDKHMRSVEEKALEYERTNRANLEADLFGTKGPSTETQRVIDRTVKGGPEKKITTTEKKIVREKVEARARGAREGFQAGKEIAKAETAAVKSKYEQTIEAIKDRQSSVLRKRNSLIEYAQAFLPAASRGKFLKAIRNTISDKEFLDTLQRMQKEADVVTRKGLISEISAELKSTKIKSKNGFPNVKFEREAQKKLNSIRANLNNDYALAQQKIADLVSDWQTSHPDEILPAEIVSEIQLLKMVGVKEMTAKELRSALADIQSIKENGRTLKEIERFNRETEIEMKRDTVFDVITGGKKLPSEFQSIRQPERQSFLKSAKEFLTTQQWGLEELMDALSFYDTKSKPYQSFLSRYVGEKTNKAFNDQNAGEVKFIDDVNTRVKEIYKIEKNSELLHLLNEMQKPVELGKVTHADGVDRNLTITRGQMIQMEMWLKDDTLAETFKDTLNWDDNVIAEARKVLTPEDAKVVDSLLEFYREYYETINPVFVKEYGIDLPFNENYSPVTRDVDVLLPENVLLAQEMRQYATAKNNSLKSRVRNKIELKPIDAFANVTRHIAKMEHYKAWSESMFEFRKIFGNKEVRRGIIDFHGDTAMKVVDNFLNDFARDGVAREKIIKEVDVIRGNATKALLGLNVRVGAKQLVGVLNYGIELPVKDLVTGVSGFWTDPVNKARFLYKNSGVLRERFGEGFERDIKFAISKGHDKTLAKTKNFSELMFIVIRNADKLTVYQGAWASYRSKYMEARKKGATDAEARAQGIQYAEEVTNRVQESSRIDTLSPIQRGGSLAKLFTMFQSQPSKYLRIIQNGMRNIKAGRGSKANNIKRIAWAWFVVPAIYNIIAEQFVDEKYRSSPGQLAVKTVLGPLSYPLITGQMVQSIYGWTAGERFNYVPSAAFAFMDDIKKAVENLTTGDITEAVTYMLDTAGKLTGVPATLFTRPFRRSLKEEGKGPKGSPVQF